MTLSANIIGIQQSFTPLTPQNLIEPEIDNDTILLTLTKKRIDLLKPSNEEQKLSLRLVLTKKLLEYWENKTITSSKDFVNCFRMIYENSTTNVKCDFKGFNLLQYLCVNSQFLDHSIEDIMSSSAISQLKPYSKYTAEALNSLEKCFEILISTVLKEACAKAMQISEDYKGRMEAAEKGSTVTKLKNDLVHTRTFLGDINVIELSKLIKIFHQSTNHKIDDFIQKISDIQHLPKRRLSNHCFDLAFKLQNYVKSTEGLIEKCDLLLAEINKPNVAFFDENQRTCLRELLMAFLLPQSSQTAPNRNAEMTSSNALPQIEDKSPITTNRPQKRPRKEKKPTEKASTISEKESKSNSLSMNDINTRLESESLKEISALVGEIKNTIIPTMIDLSNIVKRIAEDNTESKVEINPEALWLELVRVNPNERLESQSTSYCTETSSESIEEDFSKTVESEDSENSYTKSVSLLETEITTSESTEESVATSKAVNEISNEEIHNKDDNSKINSESLKGTSSSLAADITPFRLFSQCHSAFESLNSLFASKASALPNATEKQLVYNHKHHLINLLTGFDLLHNTTTHSTVIQAVIPGIILDMSVLLEQCVYLHYWKKYGEAPKHHALVDNLSSTSVWNNFGMFNKMKLEMFDKGNIWARYPKTAGLNFLQTQQPKALALISQSASPSLDREESLSLLNQLRGLLIECLSLQETLLNPNKRTDWKSMIPRFENASLDQVAANEQIDPMINKLKTLNTTRLTEAASHLEHIKANLMLAKKCPPKYQALVYRNLNFLSIVFEQILSQLCVDHHVEISIDHDLDSLIQKLPLKVSSVADILKFSIGIALHYPGYYPLEDYSRTLDSLETRAVKYQTQNIEDGFTLSNDKMLNLFEKEIKECQKGISALDKLIKLFAS